MSLNCCLFRLKKDQFSSYIISNLADDAKPDEQPNENGHVYNNQDNSQSEAKADEFNACNDLLNESENKAEKFKNNETDNQKEITNNKKLIKFSSHLSLDSNNKLSPTKLRNNVKFDILESRIEAELSENDHEQFKVGDSFLDTSQSPIDASAVDFQHQNSNSSKNGLVSNSSQASSNPLFYYELKIKLKEGKNLAIRDISGSSDPYVKFVLNGVSMYKSKIIFKNLNPEWNEDLTIKLMPSALGSGFTFNSKLNASNSLMSANLLSLSDSNLTSEQLQFFLSKFKLKIFVYDYDRGFLSDDLIGYAIVDLMSLKENIETSFELELEDEKLAKYEYLGLLLMDITLMPKYNLEEKEQINSGLAASKIPTSNSYVRNKRGPGQIWHSVINILLIEGNNLISMDDNGFSDPYVKFKLENERYRSKTVLKDLNPKYLEQFQLYVYDNNKMMLNISVYDYDSASSSDDFMGKANIDLKTLETERTHFLKVPLEDGAGMISMLVTITGTFGIESLSDIEVNNESYNSSPSYRDDVIRKYGLLNSFRNIDDIGWLQVKVLRAEGLASADINGKSDPFCCLQLTNQYVQTHTEYKTLNPEWGKVFEFNVTDIHAILEVTVLDEDKNKVYEFLGKLEIPIINIQNGKRKFYALKDRKLANRAKGAIELEMSLIYNPLKAVVKTFNPRENKYLVQEPKLKVPVLKQNIMRVHNIAQGIINTGNFIDSCFRWVNPMRSLIAFIIYMLPLTFLMIFIKNYIIIKLKSVNSNDDDLLNFEYCDEEEEAISDIDSKEPKKTFKEKLNEIQEICLKVQENLDYLASLGERIINTFTFTTPWLSWLAVVCLLIISFILYMIPLRYLILIWGINKFTKKFRKPPNYIDNTEILDFLSRVPSKKEVFQYKELRLEKSLLLKEISQTAASNPTVSPKEKKRKK